ncbi:TolC family protein [Roseateles sp. BYS87W]|uniref:TolC family protein n=1 Tax=Pelomonas baiyunensis TaxID=3299026 RepID=A0ABW7H1Q9_9BURK
MKRWVSALVLAVQPWAALAQHAPLPGWLPPAVQAGEWIEQDATVALARHGTAAAGHAAQALAAGSQEWSLRLQAQRRQFQDGPAASREWQAHVERPWRSAGKAALDAQLGRAEQDVARAQLGEARHESARALADLWVGVLAARQREALAVSQVALAEANLAAVQKRRRAGDAAVLDEQQARADVGESQRELVASRTVLTKAQAGLRTRFAAEANADARLGDVDEPGWTQAAWLARVLEEADAIKLRQAEAERVRLAASRSRADRVADPVVGVFTASEARGQERLVGLSLTLPIGGTHREQRSLQLAREADMADAALDQMRREVEQQARETWADATGSRERWQLARQTAALAAENARLVQRAYTLGEADLQSLLMARRQSGLNSQAALEAQSEALRWAARLLIDAHQIWDLEHD